MKPIFRNTVLQQQFDRDGFILIENMLSREQMDELEKLFRTIEPDGLDRMYSNIYDRSKDENVNIDRIIRQCISEKLNNILQNFVLFQCVFLVKGVGPKGVSILHQDWSSVDEDRFESLSIWCPLTDTNEENGCLYVAKGSHRIFRTVRCFTHPTVFMEFDNEIEPFVAPVYVKAGQAVIYAHNLFHGSKPNNSGTARIAVTAGIFPDEAKSLFYFQDKTKPDVIEIFETNEEFFQSGIAKFFNHARPDHLVKAGELKGKFSITRDEFIAEMKKRRSNPNFAAEAKL